VVVYPAGIGQSWNAGGCCGAASAESVDDASFIAAVVHDVLATERGTSARSVFLAGYSNGGRMAYRMACQTPGLFAGIAAVEAVPVDTCPATHLSVPFLTIASTADPLLRITPNSPAKKVDGHPQPDVVGVVAQWRRREGCTPHAQVTVTGAVTRTVWPDCTRHSQIGFSLYRDTGHAWPAGGPRTPSAQAQILDFFRHVAPGAFPPAAGR
jgi:polyhydroxybutyrate depolymerase